MSQEWPICLYEKVMIDEDADQQLVPTNDMNTSLDNEPISSSQENQVMDVIIPLADCFNCRVELTRCQIDPIVETAFIDNREYNEEEESSSCSWSWDKYFDLLSAAYPTCQQEEEEFHLAYYDEIDFDPAIFLDTSIPWMPR